MYSNLARRAGLRNVIHRHRLVRGAGRHRMRGGLKNCDQLLCSNVGAVFQIHDQSLSLNEACDPTPSPNEGAGEDA